MILKCIANRGDAIRPPRSGSLYFRETRLETLTVGATYVAQAMSLDGDDLNVLVIEDTRWPIWLPMAMFEVEDARLPSDWEFAAFSEDDSGPQGVRALRAIWGYHDIVQLREHYKDLAEGKPEAVRALLARQGHAEAD